ncbi:MAG: hypothetical protein BGO99_04770 [Nitrosospira sp. 56-18]|nr:MAG: hypothetical protein BGO99_04770 [Nitrosospira sp. 56-18]
MNRSQKMRHYTRCRMENGLSARHCYLHAQDDLASGGWQRYGKQCHSAANAANAGRKAGGIGARGWWALP